VGSAPRRDRAPSPAGPSPAAADPEHAGTDPTRRRLSDHLLGPVADILELGGDAAVALATTAGSAVVAVMRSPYVPALRTHASGGKVAVRPLRLVRPAWDPL
jgi:hypothetical protein